MINSISGKIFKKEPTTLYIENNGIVFSISICLRDYEKLPSENENIFIYTYLNVKEKVIKLKPTKIKNKIYKSFKFLFLKK